MATTTSRRDFLSRKLVNPASASVDYLGRVTTSTVDSLGRSLVAPVRINSTAYTLGNLVEFSTGELFVCTVAGTSAASQPAVPANGATVVDGTATWTRQQ